LCLKPRKEAFAGGRSNAIQIGGDDSHDDDFKETLGLRKMSLPALLHWAHTTM
jgi:hypothetical protein